MGLRSEIEDVRRQMRSEYAALLIEDARLVVKSAKLMLVQHLLEHKVRRMLSGIKANFNPAQPRVPAGNSDGGQWTNDDRNWERLRAQYARSDGITDRRVLLDAIPDPERIISGAEYAADGHHHVPRGVYNKPYYDFNPEVRRIFNNAKTGRLADPSSNLNDRMHQAYSRAIKEMLDKFIQDNNIRKGEMTPAQAYRFVGKVLSSRDPRVYRFQERLIMRELRARMPGMFRGGE
ncbi:hypothetical protein [Afipia sp. P52-10]|jgi:hypothetical protein|uniref:hypothetical protein n=1 Tax=Afipia sp. P52-10 TaxID=1429916 RepID=UPI0004BBC2A6|nr:hypothetical protein [Afipia sp. P52-10]